MLIHIVFVGIGGFFGAITRYWFNEKVGKAGDFPLATWLVNSIGSFLLGLLFNFPSSSTVYLLAGVGFLGAFTTFSTFKLEGVLLQISGKRSLFHWYTFATYGSGLLLAYFGFILGSLLS